MSEEEKKVSALKNSLEAVNTENDALMKEHNKLRDRYTEVLNVKRGLEKRNKELATEQEKLTEQKDLNQNKDFLELKKIREKKAKILEEVLPSRRS